MIAPVPWYVHLVFIATVVLTLLFFVTSLRRKFLDFPKHIVFEIILWLIGTGVIAYLGFFRDTSTVPPRLPVAAAIPALVICLLFLIRRSRLRIFRLSQRPLILIHTVRIPVEIVLWWLYQASLIPEIMTFEGRNFDILMGLSAPLIVFLVYERKILGIKTLLLWNLLGIGLLANIVASAALSMELPIQQYGFDTPNIGVTYFPFVWLPLFIVPVVLFAHVVSIVQLLRDNRPRT